MLLCIFVFSVFRIVTGVKMMNVHYSASSCQLSNCPNNGLSTLPVLDGSPIAHLSTVTVKITMMMMMMKLTILPCAEKLES